MKTIKDTISNYWDIRSKSYGIDRDKSASIEETWFRTLQELVEKAPGKQAIDIGTGTGQFALYLARSGFKVTGIDISEEMVRQAKNNALQQELDIVFNTGDAEQLNFQDGAFDVVVSRNLLWTLPEPDKALQEWHRILKPGGILVVSDGFWQNQTWKNIHRLGFKVMRGMRKNKSLISLLFFTKYIKIKNALPYYEGVHQSDVKQLLNNAKFHSINAYHPVWNPYADNMNATSQGPPFFIASATR